MTNDHNSLRRAVIAECIDALETIHVDTILADFSVPDGAVPVDSAAAYTRATLVEKLRDLGRIAPSWNPTQYDATP